MRFLRATYNGVLKSIFLACHGVRAQASQTRFRIGKAVGGPQRGQQASEEPTPLAARGHHPRCALVCSLAMST